MGEFRNYTEACPISDHYREQRLYQTPEYVKKMKETWLNKNLTVWEAFDMLDDFVDASDPDTTYPNIQHMFQSASSAYENNEPDYMVVALLIHDLGKILYVKNDDSTGQSNRKQWGIVGDTYILGIELPQCAVYPEFKPSPHKISYPLGCGLGNTVISYGHDEYMYDVLQRSEHNLPEEALYFIRFHSLYPWHTGNSYNSLENDIDKRMKNIVQYYNKYDLYTKKDDIPDMDKLKPIFTRMIEKYIPKLLRF